MQLGDEPSISQVANRFIGTGLFSAPLPGKLNRPLLSAMLAAGVPFTSSTRRSEQTSPSGSRWILIPTSAKTGVNPLPYGDALPFTGGVAIRVRCVRAASCRCGSESPHRALSARDKKLQQQSLAAGSHVTPRLAHLRSCTLGMVSIK